MGSCLRSVARRQHRIATLFNCQGPTSVAVVLHPVKEQRINVSVRVSYAVTQYSIPHLPKGKERTRSNGGLLQLDTGIFPYLLFAAAIWNLSEPKMGQL